MSGLGVRALGDGRAQAKAQGQAPYLAHLYVVQSYEEWCKAPCMAATWELAAPKPKLDSKYALFEAAIWRQERRVALYRFDPEWMSRARHAYHEVCFGESWSCFAYKAFREARVLLNVGPWPPSADRDRDELSTFLLGAFNRFVEKIRTLVPQAQHYGLTYSGHGASADGALFEGALHKSDAASWLRSLTGDVGRLAVLNFGGNCAEGRWNMVAALHPFAEWIVASDLKVGGVKLNDTENNAESVRARERLSDVSTIKLVAEEEAPVPMRGMVERIVDAREEIWKTVWRGPIERQGLRQSIAAYEGQAFPPFEAALRKAYAALPKGQRRAFEKAAEAAECDVLTAARFLENAVPDGQAAGLEDGFRAMRPIFRSTSGLVEWDTLLHGLGFNFFGWHGPPCDLVTPLGPEAKPPPGGWHGGGTPIPVEIR